MENINGNLDDNTIVNLEDNRQEFIQASKIDQDGGKNLSSTEGYGDFFGSLHIREYSQNALLAEMRRRKDVLPSQIIIEDIGGGDGFVLDGLINVADKEGFDARGILADAREDEVCLNKNPKVAKLPGDATEQIIPDGGVSFVHARSVMQYFPSEEGQKRFFTEIKRVLEPGGQFINAAAYMDTPEKAKLLQDIHNLIGKKMSLPTKEDLIGIHEKEFDSVVEAVEQISSEDSLYTDEKAFYLRYSGLFQEGGLEWSVMKEEIYELISAVDEKERPGVFVLKDNEEIRFGWSVPYLILVCE